MKILRHRPLLGALCALLAFAALLAVENSSSKGSTMRSRVAGTDAASGVSSAQALLNKYSGLTNTFAAPGPAIPRAKTLLKGKTVYFVPYFLEAGYFEVEEQTLKSILGRLGAKLQVCDAKGSPTTTAGCINQAVSAHAAGIITDAILVGFAQQAYTNAVAHKIPVVAAEDILPSPAGKAFARYLTPVGLGTTLLGQLEAASTIVDSKGHANILFADDTTTPLTKSIGAGMVSTLKADCRGCTIQSVTFQDTELQNVASQVQSALVKDSSAQYVVTQYDDPSGSLVFQGAEQGKPGIKFVAASGDTNGLHRVEQGQELADPGVDPVSASWNNVDALLRIAAGMPSASKHYYALHREFTKSNVTPFKNQLTIAGWASAKWYTKTAPYQKTYLKLWGLS